MKTLSVGLLAAVVLFGAGSTALAQDDGQVAEQRNTAVFHIEGMT